MSLRIAVCTSQEPFETGGTEVLSETLVDQLRQRGHQVELVRLPLAWVPRAEVTRSYLAWRLINLRSTSGDGKPIDRVIATKFPSYVVEHPYKITWLIHQFRQIYDLYGTAYSDFSADPADTQLRETIMRVDSTTLAESRHLFSISANVGQRLKHFNGLDSEVLYPPPPLDGQFYQNSAGDYILSVSRLNLLKRVDHLVRAMAQVKTPARCVIVGRGPDLPQLQQLARKLGVESRIEFRGFVPNDELLRLYAGALAAYYAPLDEDYGFATLEAMKAGKSVLTTTDSGGVLEFTRDRSTGLLSPPNDAAALARNIDELYEDRALAERMGAAGAELVQGITWDATIRRLLEV
ncbi:MAG: glycosyltransferase family 4 protein [Chloroflexi bacterium]|nr:glycosyltransferase family 4 protein [Chloroflexota bacterium]